MEMVLWLTVGALLGFALGWGLFSGRGQHVLAKNQLLVEELEQLKSERTEFHERAVKAEAAVQMHAKNQEQLRHEFKNTANTLFEEISNKFTVQSEKKIGDLLHPMRERLAEFQKLVVDSFGTQGKEQHTLKSEIEKIVLQTDSLTKALRGDVKAQGNWGEVMLERILEESGLRRDTDYVLQGVDMGLAAADGSRQMPDVIIKLPEEKHVIIDSKVSITAYDRFCAEPDEMKREAHAREFVQSVKNHVVGLEKKRYQHNEKLAAPDFVLMFMPTEGAFSFAVQNDPELHSYAWGRKIVIVSPTTLFATLRTVASLWRIEQQNRYALQIADEGGKMYDKFVSFVEDMSSIGTQLERTQKIYEGALNKLKTGTGNLVARAEKMKQLGAKASKALPKDMADEEEEGDQLKQIA